MISKQAGEKIGGGKKIQFKRGKREGGIEAEG